MAIIKPATWAQPNHYPRFMSHSSAFQEGIFGMLNMFAGKTNQDMIDRGVTHIMDTGGTDHTNYPPAVKFALVKIAHLGVDRNTTDYATLKTAGRNYANAISHNLNTVITSEIIEELDGADPSRFPDSLTLYVAFYEGVFEKMTEFHSGITLTVNQTNAFDDYNGYTGTGELDAGTESDHVNSMASQTAARREWDDENGNFSTTQNTLYFRNNAYNYTNILHKRYYRSLMNLSGLYILQLIYDIEKCAIAAPDRKQAVFSWDLIQDNLGGQPIIAHRSGHRYQYSNGTMYIGENRKGAVPFPIAFQLAFFTHLLCDNLLLWGDTHGIEDVAISSSNNRQTFGYDVGPTFYEDGVRKSWVATNGTDAQPTASGVGTGTFSKYPKSALDGFHQGVDCKRRIKNYYNTSLKWAKYSTNNGASYTTPVSGSSGAAVSRPGAANPGQHNVVLTARNSRGIALFGEGSAGKVCIWLNPFKTPLESDTVRFEQGGIVYNLGVIPGGTLHIQTF